MRWMWSLANYSPGGYLGRLSETMYSLSAHPAFELPSPFLWGDEDELRRRFAGFTSSIEVEHHTLYFESPTVQSFLEFWDETNPPQAAMKGVMPPDTYQKALSLSAQLVAELNESHDGRLKLSSPYILVVARKTTE